MNKQTISISYNFHLVFACACIGMLLFGIVMLTLGATLPDIMSKFGLDEMGAGTLASLLPTGILLGSLFFGPIVDRYSYKYLLIFCALAVAASMFGIALAKSIGLLQISFLLIGLGGGALNGGTNALVADISKDHQAAGSANLSLLGVFFGLGALLVPSLMALLSKVWTFEQILIGIGSVIILAVIFFFAIRFPAPKQTQSVPFKESLHLFKDGALILLAFLLFFQSAFEGVFNNWTTTFLERERSLSSTGALTSLSIFVGSLTVMRLLLAGLLRRIKEQMVLLVSLGVLVMGVLIMMYAKSTYLFYIGTGLLGTGTAAIFPITLGFVSEMYDHMRGTAFSVVMFIAVIGNVIANFLMGVLAKHYGINLYTWVLLGCIICIGIFVGMRGKT